jgi:hypothetical protein
MNCRPHSKRSHRRKTREAANGVAAHHGRQKSRRPLWVDTVEKKPTRSLSPYGRLLSSEVWRQFAVATADTLSIGANANCHLVAAWSDHQTTQAGAY